jgi:hypothetical protein
VSEFGSSRGALGSEAKAPFGTVSIYAQRQKSKRRFTVNRSSGPIIESNPEMQLKLQWMRFFVGTLFMNFEWTDGAFLGQIMCARQSNLVSGGNRKCDTRLFF